jgi:hypothetical protein
VHKLTDAEWEVIRHLARNRVEVSRRKAFPLLRLTRIDLTALRQADTWLGPSRRADWDWREVVKRPKPNRFELALWHGEQLCGLAFGPANTQVVCMEYLEGNPDAVHPLKRRVADIAIATLETHVRVSGAVEARLLGPKPALVSYYEAFGYRLEVEPRGLQYLVKHIPES